MAREKVILDTRGYPKFRSKVLNGTKRGIERNTVKAAAAIRRRAPVGDGVSGAVPGHMRDTIHPTRARKRRRGVGFDTAVVSYDPTALWQDKGTLGRRSTKAKTKKAEIRRKFYRQTSAGRKVGVRPHRFFLKGLREVFPTVIGDIRRMI